MDYGDWFFIKQLQHRIIPKTFHEYIKVLNKNIGRLEEDKKIANDKKMEAEGNV